MYNNTATNVYKRLKDWLNRGDSSEITDTALDLLNRGNRRIAGERNWDFLEVTSSLTLSASNTATLPDMDVIHEVYTDDESDGKPDRFYFNEGRQSSGYTVTNTFVQASGWTRTIQFFDSPSATPIVRYKRTVPDFTSDYANEYLIFPENLLLRAAQVEHMAEANLDINLYTTILNDYNRELKKAVMLYEDENVDMRSEIKDEQGDRIITENYYLNGDIGTLSGDGLKERDVLP